MNYTLNDYSAIERLRFYHFSGIQMETLPLLNKTSSQIQKRQKTVFSLVEMSESTLQRNRVEYESLRDIRVSVGRGVGESISTGTEELLDCLSSAVQWREKTLCGLFLKNQTEYGMFSTQTVSLWKTQSYLMSQSDHHTLYTGYEWP